MTLWYALTENWKKETVQIFSGKTFPQWDTRCLKTEKKIKSGYIGYWDEYQYCLNKSCTQCEVLQNEENFNFVKSKLMTENAILI